MKLRVSVINLFLSKNKKLCGGFIDVPERIQNTQITKMESMQLQMKLDILTEATSKEAYSITNTALGFMHMSGVNKTRQGWTARR